jgi:hypothetical protein
MPLSQYGTHVYRVWFHYTDEGPDYPRASLRQEQTTAKARIAVLHDFGPVGIVIDRVERLDHD